MPVKNIDFVSPYDFHAWRVRVGAPGPAIDKKAAAFAVGVSYATWNRAEEAAQGQKTLVWACYGVEQAIVRQRAGE